MEFIYCRRLNSQYFGAPKSGAPKMRPPAVAGTAGVVPTLLGLTHVIVQQNTRRLQKIGCAVACTVAIETSAKSIAN